MRALKNVLYLSGKVFNTKVVIGETIFTSPTGDGTAILRGHPSHAKVSLQCRRILGGRNLVRVKENACTAGYAKVYLFAGQRKYLHCSVTVKFRK